MGQTAKWFSRDRLALRALCGGARLEESDAELPEDVVLAGLLLEPAPGRHRRRLRERRS